MQRLILLWLSLSQASLESDGDLLCSTVVRDRHITSIQVAACMPAHSKRKVAEGLRFWQLRTTCRACLLQEGGETVFPNAGPKVTGEGWSECARQGFAVKAKRGDAVLFWVAACLPHACCPPQHTLAVLTSLQRTGLKSLKSLS